MNLLHRAPLLILVIFLLATTACGNGKASQPTPVPTVRVIEPTNPLELRRATPTPEPTARPELDTSAILIVRPTATPWPLSEIASYPALPNRTTSRPPTTGDVPHYQLGVEPVPEINNELFRLAFSLPDVEVRPTTVSLPGARGLWISDDVKLTRPDAVSSGREFTHIHPDGSLHLPLPPDRAMEAGNAGWGEQHPLAGQGNIYGGLMLIYTPQTMQDLDTVVRLIVESYNFVTARNIEPLDVIRRTLYEPEPTTEKLPQRRDVILETNDESAQQQLDSSPGSELQAELLRRVFSIPDLQDRPSVVSSSESRGLRLSRRALLVRPDAVIQSRELGHVHTDGSLHIPLPPNLATEVIRAGWAEPHPRAGERDGWEGLVSLYAPRTTEEVDIVVQIIVASYNFVTGRSLNAEDF